MSPRRWQMRIQDILDAIQEINDFTEGLTFETFQIDLKAVRAVELDFIIIGEAANQIPDEVIEAHPEVPWHLMRAVRNRLVHVYFSVDAQLLWDTVQDQLPELVPPLRSLLDE